MGKNDFSMAWADEMKNEELEDENHLFLEIKKKEVIL